MDEYLRSTYYTRIKNAFFLICLTVFVPRWRLSLLRRCLPCLEADGRVFVTCQADASFQRPSNVLPGPFVVQPCYLEMYKMRTSYCYRRIP
jgi:hypothetical protein